MGGAKRDMEEQEAMYGLGLNICVEAGAIEECEFHPGSFYEGQEDVVEAYKLAARNTKAGAYGDLSQTDVTDAVKQAYEDNCGIDYCSSCDRNAADG